MRYLKSLELVYTSVMATTNLHCNAISFYARLTDGCELPENKDCDLLQQSKQDTHYSNNRTGGKTGEREGREPRKFHASIEGTLADSEEPQRATGGWERKVTADSRGCAPSRATATGRIGCERPLSTWNTVRSNGDVL